MKRLAQLSCAILLSAACGTTDPGESGGTRVLLTDAPFPFDLVQSVNIHIVSVSATAEMDTIMFCYDEAFCAPEWVTIAEPNQRFDLLELQRGATALVAEGDLPASQFNAVQLMIDTERSDIILLDGTEAAVQWPVVGELALHARVEHPLSITDGPSDANIIIDFDVGRSFQLFNDVFVFIPVIRAVNEDATGTIMGTVNGSPGMLTVVLPVPDAIITVYRGNAAVRGTWWVVATGRSDASGAFSIHYVSGGDYIVQAEAPSGSAFEGTAVATNVLVNAGEETEVELMLGVSDVVPPDPELRIWGARSLFVGQSTLLQAVRLEADGDTIADAAVEARWLNENPAVLQLDGTGSEVTVTGLTLGTSTVFATDGELADSVVIHVVVDSSSTD
jgi:hypothetical protein